MPASYLKTHNTFQLQLFRVSLPGVMLGSFIPSTRENNNISMFCKSMFLLLKSKTHHVYPVPMLYFFCCNTSFLQQIIQIIFTDFGTPRASVTHISFAYIYVCSVTYEE